MSSTLLSSVTQLKEHKNKHTMFFPYKKSLEKETKFKINQ